MTFDLGYDVIHILQGGTNLMSTMITWCHQIYIITLQKVNKQTDKSEINLVKRDNIKSFDKKKQKTEAR